MTGERGTGVGGGIWF